jgi:hypothetical protein
MKKWEYKLIRFSTVEKMNDLGNDRWELVSVIKEDNKTYAIFKREIEV